MAVNLPLPNKDELKPISGLRLGIAEAGIKRANRKDILVIRLVPGSSVLEYLLKTVSVLPQFSFVGLTY